MNINVFEHQLFGKVRKTNDETGNVWMAAVDVCNVLEYKDLRKAIQRYVQNIDKKLIIMNTPGGMQNSIFINVQGVYDLCLHSRMPKAREFQTWITHEVLMDVRKYGMYIADNPPVEEYDENGLPIVLEWTKPKMREMLNKYFIEIHNERRKNEELGKKLEEAIEKYNQLDSDYYATIMSNARLRMAVGEYEQIYGRFSVNNINTDITQDVISDKIPVRVAIKNFFEAASYLGFGGNYDLFTTFLVDEGFCIYVRELNLITPTRVMEYRGFFKNEGMENGIIYYTLTKEGLSSMESYMEKNNTLHLAHLMAERIKYIK